MDKNKSLVILSSIFIASLVTANLIGSKLFILFGVTVSAGIIVLPVTFLVTDIMSEIFGKKITQQVVITGIIIQVYVLIVVYLGGLFPADPRRDLTEAYNQMFSLTPRMVLASIVAYSVSQNLDVLVFHYLKEKFGGAKLWLRNNLSTMLSQAVDSFIFLGIFLGGILSLEDWIKTYISLYLLKVLFAALDTPLCYLGVQYFGKEHKANA